MFLVEQVFVGRDENRASLKRLRGRLLFLETEKRTFFLNPPPPPNFCITVVANLSWELESSKAKSKTLVMIFFYGGGGGCDGLRRCLMVYVKFQ